MPSNELLATYLNDHLAGAAAGVELAEKLGASYEGTPFGTAVAAVTEEIKVDRDTLQALIERLGIGKSPVKQAAGWVFEKATRLRFNRHLTGSDALTRMLETETLSLGIEGKLALWQALKGIDGLDTELGRADFDRLIFRARQQRETLEPYRLEAATEAFTAPPDG
ncbi:MAG TPA: hypothetical protein VF880_11910 [Actinomycetes bacterium]|jgi:hypothetical protein